MKYEKETVKGDGRHLRGGGPRDIQKRQRMQALFGDSDLVGVLREEISNLKSELSNHPTSRGAGEFTAEQVNDEVNKAVAQTITELKLGFEGEKNELKANALRLNSELDHLKQKIVLTTKDHEFALKEATTANGAEIGLLKAQLVALEEKVADKEGVIDDLKDALSRAGTRSEAPVEVDPDRPQMEQVFIDPLEVDAGKELESHITVEDVSVDIKEDMADKVNKLKNIMGKLPIKHKPIVEEEED